MVDADRDYTEAELFLLGDDDLRDLARAAYEGIVREQARHITGYNAAHRASMQQMKTLSELMHRASAYLKSRKGAAE